MDDKRFDALTRSLAEGTSRRRVLKGLLGGLVGGAAVATQIDQASADHCETGTFHCNDELCCPDALNCCGGTACCSGSQCNSAGVCCLESEFACVADCCDTASENCCGGTTCCPSAQCNQTSGVCCAATEFTCGAGCCDTLTEKCCEGVCIPASGCCGDAECGTPPDICTAFNCVNNVCETEGGCPAGELCCDFQGGSCAPCCSSGETTCVEPTPFCLVAADETNNTCVECLEPADCGDCETCSGNACVPIICEACTICSGNECIDDPATFDCPADPSGCCPNAEACCVVDGCCTGVCYGGTSLRDSCCDTLFCEAATECCADPANEKCCGTSGCCAGQCYGEGDNLCCEESTHFVCEGPDECCRNEQNCCTLDGCCDGSCNLEGECCPSVESFACGGDCCDNETEKCCDGLCISADLCCPSLPDCGDCETCYQGECIDDCGPCETCYAGTCFSDCGECEICEGDTCERVCPIDEICCISGPPNDQTITCAADCCGDEDCLDECSVCYDGQCIGCGPGEECCRGVCVDEGDCCREFGEECGLIVNNTTIAGELQLDCCDGLVCCEAEVGPSGPAAMFCAECCADWHCDKGFHCCHGECIPDDRCCDDHDCGFCEFCFEGHCRQEGALFGETCGVVTITEGGSPQLDCCDGLVCCGVHLDDDDLDDNDLDGGVCAECCGDWDCPKGSECHHGVCKFECRHDKDCPDHTCCCKSGHCSKHCCEHKDDDKKPDKKPDEPEDDKGDVDVDTLPSTGAGPGESNAGWLGAAALGAAAAYLASKKLKDEAPEPDAAEE